MELRNENFGTLEKVKKKTDAVTQSCARNMTLQYFVGFLNKGCFFYANFC